MALADCDNEIYTNGVTVGYATTQGAEAFEGWIELVRKQSGQRVDWHYVAGRAVIKVLGDVEAVKRAMMDLRTQHTGQLVF